MAQLVAGDGITLTYESGGDTLTIEAGGGGATTDETFVVVRNDTGVTLTKGTPVKDVGNVIAGVIRVVKADASDPALMPALGLINADLADGAVGAVQAFGVLETLDTSAWASGTRLYVSSTPGTLTSTSPTSPDQSQRIAVVTVSHAVSGALLILDDPALGGAAEDHSHTGTGDGGEMSGATFAAAGFWRSDTPAAPGSTDVLSLGVAVDNGLSLMQTVDIKNSPVKVGETRHHLVKNTSGGTINRGEAVYVSGQADSFFLIAKAKGDAVATMAAVGVCARNIANGDYGYVLADGRLTNFDTLAYTVGDILYVSAGTAGALTATKPGGLAQPLCRVLVDHATDGVLLMLPAQTVKTSGISVNLGDGTNVIAASEPAVYARVPFPCVVTGWYVLSEISGSITVIVSRAPTGSATFTEISGGSDPFLSTDNENSDLSIAADWSDVTLDEGDTLSFTVTGSPASVKRVAVSLVLARIG